MHADRLAAARRRTRSSRARRRTTSTRRSGHQSATSRQRRLPEHAEELERRTPTLPVGTTWCGTPRRPPRPPHSSRPWRSSNCRTPRGSPSSRARSSASRHATGSITHTPPSATSACEVRCIALVVVIHPKPKSCSSQKRTASASRTRRQSGRPYQNHTNTTATAAVTTAETAAPKTVSVTKRSGSGHPDRHADRARDREPVRGAEHRSLSRSRQRIRWYGVGAIRRPSRARWRGARP